MTDYTSIDSDPDLARKEELYGRVDFRFVPSTEELYHWIHYGTEEWENPCQCVVCNQMRRLGDSE